MGTVAVLGSINLDLVVRVRALTGVGPAAWAGVPALTAALKHREARVRKAAAEALGKFGPAAHEAADALRKALGDDNAEVRQAASDALLNLASARP